MVQKEGISDRQGIALLMLFMIGSAIVVIPGLEAKKDIWIANILAALITIPVSLIYSRIISLYPGKDLYDILPIVLGKTLGKVVAALYIWFAFHLGALVIRNFGDFVSVVGLDDTPMIIPMIFLAVLCAWGVKEGINTLASISAFFGPLIVFFILSSALTLIPKMEINNIFPVLYEGIQPVLEGTFGLFSFPLAETVLFLMVFNSLKTRQSAYRIYIISIIFFSIFAVTSALVMIMVLGVDIASTSYFPSYLALRKIEIGGFLSGLEIVISLSFLIAGFIKISICILASSAGAAKVLGARDYRFIVLPVTMLMVNMAYFVYDNIKQSYHWALEIWPTYAFLFQFILPVIILIAAEVRVRRK